MLVTFKTPAHANVTMFGDVATHLLKLMGHSQTIPSAIGPQDIPRALRRLREGMKSAGEDDNQPDAEDDEPAVSLHNRAMPLIELFEAALSADVSVMWEEGDG